MPFRADDLVFVSSEEALLYLADVTGCRVSVPFRARTAQVETVVPKKTLVTQISDALEKQAEHDPKTIARFTRLFKDKLRVKGKKLENVMGTERNEYFLTNFDKVSRSGLVSTLKQAVERFLTRDPRIVEFAVRQLGLDRYYDSVPVARGDEFVVRSTKRLLEAEEEALEERGGGTAVVNVKKLADALLEVQGDTERARQLRRQELSSAQVRDLVNELAKRVEQSFSRNDNTTMDDVLKLLGTLHKVHRFDAKKLRKRFEKTLLERSEKREVAAFRPEALRLITRVAALGRVVRRGSAV